MKITKRQLKRIIKKEKSKILRESIMDMSLMQDVLGSFPESLAGAFGDRMMDFFWEEDAEETDTFRDTSEAQWEAEVDAAEQQLVSLLEEVITKAGEDTEVMLHDGQFRRNR